MPHPRNTHRDSIDRLLAVETTAAWVPGATLTTLGGAMNSSVWMVEGPAGRHVLKITDRAGAPGLRAAACLEARGVEAGAPVRVHWRGGRVVALLRHVDGPALVAADARRIGSTLGLVHAALRDVRAPRTADRWPWEWLDPAEIRDADLRAAATSAVERANDLAPAMTHGMLHGDPAPEAFIDRGKTTALIDWGAAVHGPLLYDVASAVMYAGRAVVRGYAETGPLASEELHHLDAFRAFRWAVQAWYFSGRIARNDLTGIGDPAENDVGLAEARAALLG